MITVSRVVGCASLALGLMSLGAWAETVGPLDAEGVAALPEADVYVVGEFHDNPAHHEGQAAVIEALQPQAVVFEMLTAEQAGAWTPGLVDDMVALDATLAWSESGWPDAMLYEALFKAIPDGAAVIGGAPNPTAVRQATWRSAARVFNQAQMGQAARFALDQPLPADQKAEREAEQDAAHCDALPEGLASGFVEAQRLRDAAMAKAVIEAVEEHGTPVVLIAGNGHARTDWGVPAALRLGEPDLDVVSIGQLEDGAPEGTEAPPFDVVVVTDPPPGGRNDPCADFALPEGSE